MNRCPCCGWPLGNRAFAPPGGTAPCVADRHLAEEITWALAAHPQRGLAAAVDLAEVIDEARAERARR